MALVTWVPAPKVYTEVSHLLFPTGNTACACI